MLIYLAQLVKNLPIMQGTVCSAGDIRDVGSISGLGRSPGKGNGNPLQYAFFHGKSHGQRSLVDYSPLGHKEHRHNVEVVVSNTPQDSLLKKEAAGVLTPKSYTCNWMTQAT